MSLVVLFGLGLVAALCGVFWLHGHMTAVTTFISRSTTVPSGVAHTMNSVVPGSADAVQNAANKVASAATDAANKVG